VCSVRESWYSGSIAPSLESPLVGLDRIVPEDDFHWLASVLSFLQCFDIKGIWHLKIPEPFEFSCRTDGRRELAEVTGSRGSDSHGNGR